MQAQPAQPSKLVKALRVAFAFLLVLGPLFQAEIALAVKYGADGSGTAVAATGGTSKPYDQGDAKPQDKLKLSGFFLMEDVVGEGAASDAGVESSEPRGGSGSHYKDEYSDIADFGDPYTVAEMKSLPSYGRETYQMVSGKDGKVGITGEGATLADVLDSLVEGISASKAIEQVKFVDCDGGTVTYAWSDLVSGSTSPMLAVESLVHAPEGAPGSSASSSSASSSSSSESDESDEPSESASGDSAELKSNTRFRLLYDDPSGSVGDVNAVVVDADRLRSIKEIVINPQLDPEERPDADYSVSLRYAPVPVGEMATFAAQTTGSLSEADFTWEESSDGGKTWKALKETSAQYRVKTTAENLGHIIKVTAKAVDNPEISDSDQKKISEPEENDKIMFDLVYQPPVADDVAFFQVELASGDIDLTTLDYIWEYAVGDNGIDDDGWTPLHESYQGAPTLSIQTSEIADAGDSPEMPVSMRCRVVQERGDDGGPWIAGPVDFRVRSGGDGNDELAGGHEGPVSDGSGGDPRLIDLSNAAIDEEAGKRIAEQKAVEQAEPESTAPGIRWTAIKAKGASGNDGRNIFGDNPFAPLAILAALGLTVAGGVEKLLAFRRQL